MKVTQMETQLLELGFYIDAIREIDYGQQIRLGCGAVINVYDKGTVLVQGRLHPDYKEESLKLLRQLLPPDTRWCEK